MMIWLFSQDSAAGELAFIRFRLAAGEPAENSRCLAHLPGRRGDRRHQVRVGFDAARPVYGKLQQDRLKVEVTHAGSLAFRLPVLLS